MIVFGYIFFVFI